MTRPRTGARRRDNWLTRKAASKQAQNEIFKVYLAFDEVLDFFLILLFDRLFPTPFMLRVSCGLLESSFSDPLGAPRHRLLLLLLCCTLSTWDLKSFFVYFKSQVLYFLVSGSRLLLHNDRFVL